MDKETTKKLTFNAKVDNCLEEPGIGHRFYLELTKPFLSPGKKILDIGCWNGKFLKMVERGNFGVEIFGIDLEKRALEVAQENIQSGKFFEGSVYNIPAEIGVVDVVTFWAVIEHLPIGREVEALRNISRLLKPGGYLFLMTEYDHLLSKLFDPAYFLIGHRHYSKQKLAELLNASGFRVENVCVKGAFWEGFSILLMYFFKHILHRSFRSNFFERMIIKESAGEGFNLIYLRALKI